jgi:hypothetical protein
MRTVPELPLLVEPPPPPDVDPDVEPDEPSLVSQAVPSPSRSSTFR